MVDLERIQRLAEKLGNRKESLEIVRQMRCGGKKYGDGGDKRERQRMFDEVTSDILEQSRYNGRASGVNNIDYPLVDLHPELDLSLMLTQPGSAFTKLMAPTAYRGMVNGFANGEGAQALIYGLSPETGEWSEISKRAAEMQEGNFKKYSHYMAVGEKERLPKHIASTKKNLVERGITPDGEPYVVRKNVMVGNEDLPYKNPFFHSESYSGPDSWANSGSGSWKVHGYPDGGKFFRTNLQNESPLMYQPILPSYPDVPTPMRYEPLPHYGLYEYPSTTGMAENYPVTLPPRVPVTVSRNVSAPEVVEAPIENLFSDEMIARRALKQRYAESAFNDKAKSKAGAQGAWQIMPITLKDYLGRGRGKTGDLNDPEYNRKVRDWVMGIIPRDLKEFWSESDSDRAKLAKLYAAYNWGAGNLRGFLRKKQKAGVDISNPDNWVDDLNPETRRYVKYLAFDEDIPDSTVYTNAAFEKAAAERGYANGGNLFETGGPSSGMNPLTNLFRAARDKYLTDYANSGRMYSYPYNTRSLVENYILSPYNYRNGSTGTERDQKLIDDYINGSAQRRALFSKYYNLENTDFKPEDYIVESNYRPSKSTDPNAKYYTYKIDDGYDRSMSFFDNNGKVKIDSGGDENGNYISIYDTWDLAPFGSRVGNQMGGTPIEMYDRFYESENPRVYYRLKDMASDDEYASGGKIHIKPENRGKFTALKKRTGHSASWFKAHGTPAQKKMAVFALNSRKWKHGDGGPIDRYSPEQIRAAIAKLKETKK